MPALLAIVVPLVAALVVLLLIDRRRGRRRGSRTHAMGRDDTVSYFRDFGDPSGAPGVREEDRTERWGKGDDQSR